MMPPFTSGPPFLPRPSLSAKMPEAPGELLLCLEHRVSGLFPIQERGEGSPPAQAAALEAVSFSAP